MGVVGVEITTSLRAGPVNPAGPKSARFYAAGVTERGPVDKSLRVTSIAQYEALYGPRTSFAGAMYDTAQMFFEEGGAELFPCRVVGAGKTTGFLVIKDRTGVTPPDTLEVRAIDPGAWSTDLSVSVANGGVANTVTVTLFLQGRQVEAWANMDTVAALVAAMGSSRYVRGLDKGSASAYPTRLPVVTAATALSAGNDDRASVTAATTAAALNIAGSGLGSGAVAAPGYTAAQVGALLIAHAKANRRVAILAGAPDSDDAELLSFAAALSLDGESGGVFGPYVLIPDGSGVRKVSPEGYVAGVRARAQTLTGFWQVPAGARSAARFVLGPARAIDRAANDTLALGGVSGILTVGATTQLYGWRSLSVNPDMITLNNRDTLNAIANGLDDTLAQYVFATIDGRGQLQGEVKGAIVGYLQPIASAGGLFKRLNEAKQETDPGYSVQVDPNVIGNQIVAAVAVRLSPTAELIRVSLVKVALGASV